MKTSNAVVLSGPNQLSVEQFAVPDVPEDGAILRVEFSGICGTDLAQVTGRFVEMGMSGAVCIPGHEPVGVISKIGEIAARRWNLKPGDRVAVEPHLSCGHCQKCIDGFRTLCEVGEYATTNYGFMDINHEPALWGGHSQYMYLDPRTVLHRIPNDLDPALAVLFNPIGAGVHWAVNTPNLRVGDTVLVLGAGQRGLAAIIAAKAAGASLIIASDLSSSQHKLELARLFGADAVIEADREDVKEKALHLTNGQGVDIVLDNTPKAVGPIADAVSVVRNGGTIVLAGAKGGGNMSNIDPDDIVLRSIRLQGVFSVSSASYRNAIDMIHRSPHQYEQFQTKFFPLDGYAEAMKTLQGQGETAETVHVALNPWL